MQEFKRQYLIDSTIAKPVFKARAYLDFCKNALGLANRRGIKIFEDSVERTEFNTTTVEEITLFDKDGTEIVVPIGSNIDIYDCKMLYLNIFQRYDRVRKRRIKNFPRRVPNKPQLQSTIIAKSKKGSVVDGSR